MRPTKSWIETVFLMGIVAVTLSTGYIHYWIGGVLLTLNAAGYLSLAAAVTVTALFQRRLLPLVLVALAGYAAVTIVAWLVIGPYFDIANLAKAIEIALITTIAITLRRSSHETKAAVGWLAHRPEPRA
jgi:hypothetical protein